MVHIEEENNRCFAQYGKIGKNYYYTRGDEEGKKRAIKKANAQAPSIEKFIRSYWNIKEDFSKK